MKRNCFLLLASIGFGAGSALAANFPKSGTTELTNYVTARPLATLEVGGQTLAVDEVSGVLQNSVGQPVFHNMSVRCLQRSTRASGRSLNLVGDCLLTDGNGDTIYWTYSGPYDSSPLDLKSGTGKYKGISGQAALTRTPVHQLPGGTVASVNHLKVSWKIE
jgi:hypothetical protein